MLFIAMQGTTTFTISVFPNSLTFSYVQSNCLISRYYLHWITLWHLCSGLGKTKINLAQFNAAKNDGLLILCRNPFASVIDFLSHFLSSSLFSRITSKQCNKSVNKLLKSDSDVYLSIHLVSENSFRFLMCRSSLLLSILCQKIVSGF